MMVNLYFEIILHTNFPKPTASHNFVFYHLCSYLKEMKAFKISKINLISLSFSNIQIFTTVNIPLFTVTYYLLSLYWVDQ